jgi:predicted metal-binding membrane protein
VLSALSIDRLRKQERLLLLGGICAVTALTWGYMAHEARTMNMTGVCRCAGMKMSGPDLQPWSKDELLPLFLMWSEMMVAMMLPSATPMILTFAAVNRKRAELARPFTSTIVFLSGYLLVWVAFSAIATVAQWILHSFSLLSSMMVSTSATLGAALLIAAGIFQWTPFKQSCLAHCSNPLGLLMNDWREGNRGALTMGLRHGVYCTGCCWLLMLLLFVTGVMNVWWIAILSVFVLLEKALPRGNALGKVAGLALIIWGIWMLLKH